MKKTALFLVLASICQLSIGQEIQTAVAATLENSPIRNQVNFKQMFTKGGGDIIWQTSFDWENPDDPRGWTLPDEWEIHDNTDLGSYWIWGKDSVHNGWRNIPAADYFETFEDGFIYIPIGQYNRSDGVESATPADSYIQTEPIDCSSASSVVVRFTQEFILCCTNFHLELLVSADEGAHWAIYDTRFDVTANVYTPERHQNIEINVSDVAAGAPNVLLRFHMWGNSYYYWSIDDLALIEAYDHDMVLEDTWMDFDGGFDATMNHINYWPKSQMGIAGENSGTVGSYFTKGAVLNKGMADAEEARLNLSILRNGEEVHTATSESKSIWSLDRDTMYFDSYFPDDYGDYRFDFSVTNDIYDQVPIDNTSSMSFTVNDTLSHIADFTPETGTNLSGWVGGGNEGDMACVFYKLYSPAEISTITAYLRGFRAEETPQFQFVLFKDVEDEMVEWCGSEIMEMDSSYQYSWVTLPILKDGETEFLESGQYAACVRMWGYKEDDENGTNGIFIGRDLTTKFSGCMQYYAYGETQWTNLAGAPLFMIGYNIVDPGGPTIAPVTFNVDINSHIINGEFNPENDFLDIAGSFNGWDGSEQLTDVDGDGIYTITIEGMPVGEEIEFKYRINGNWDTSEFPDGGPNRSYTIRYWNDLDHLYNDGLTTGIEEQNNITSLKVYPNPNSGRFTIYLSNTIPSVLEIALVDIQGQIVYSKILRGVTEHQVTIDNKLSSGIYFLNINNGHEVDVRKVIVH